MSMTAAIDGLWQQAPCGAVRLWPDGERVRWQLNRAAIEWSLQGGLVEADWDAALGAAPPAWSPAPSGTILVASCGIDYRALALPQGWLLWLSPQPLHGEPARGGWRGAREKLALMQGFERVGFFERHLRGGRGWWDHHMFRLMGLPPALQAPSFEQMLQCVHPDDRARLVEHHRQSVRQAGRYEVRYRLTPAGGPVRDVQVLTEVRSGADGLPTTMLGVLIDDTEGTQRVRAQQSVSDELSRALELAKVSVWRLDLQQRRMVFNDIGYALSGVAPSPDGMDVDAVRALAHPDDRGAIIDAAERAVASDDVVDLEMRYRNADGSWRHLLTRRVAERDARGQAVALLGVSLDQTEQIATRAREQALAQHIQLVSDAAGVGMWSIVEADDGRAPQVEWNAQMFVIHGLPRQPPAPPLADWLGRLVHVDDRARVLAERRRAQRADRSDFETEFRIVRPDGGVRWVVCRSHREPSDSGSLLHGICLDLTAQRALQAQLRLHEQRLKLATQNAGVGIWERDMDSGQVQWEEQMYRLRGLQPDDARTPLQIDRQLVSPRDFAERQRRIERHLVDGQAYEYEFEVQWPDGSLHWLVSTGCAVRDGDGKPLRMVGLNWDVTQRKRAEAARRDAEAAERASRAKSQFLARMSHELRTPLNAMLGFTQLLEHDGAGSLDALQRERLARIRSAGDHLLALIDEVLDLSAVEAGSLPLALQTIELDPVLDEVRQWLAPLAAQGGVALQLASTQAWVRADARRLRQVLANLISNAIKYNRRGGRVELRAQRGVVDGVAGWELAVRDTGRGLSAEQQAHLFEPFNRLGAEREGIEGRGIGLATVHHLVQAMGGRLQLQSRVGQGSEFRVWLPQAAARGPDSAVGAAVGASQRADIGAALSVLYIEDNAINVLVMQELVALRPAMALHVAPDGASGIDAVRRLQPDLVLIDLQLPDMDGFELLRRLRAQPLPATAIALSANATAEAAAQARAAGFDDYWTKPIDVARLLAGLDRLAAARAAVGTASSTTDGASGDGPTNSA